MLTPVRGAWGLLPAGSSQGAGERAFRCWWTASCGAAPPWSTVEAGDVSFTVSRENSVG